MRRKLHVLMVHCYYRELGGENLSFEAEAGLLEANGVRVTTYTRDNREFDGAGPLRQARAGIRTTWADDAYAAVRASIRRDRPDVVHFQNTFPLISPAAIHAAHRMGVPVVQALRNYRLLCAKAVLFRDGGVCRDCVGRTIPVPAMVHQCYRGSLPRTAAVVSMQVAHRALGTWRDAVTLYVTPSAFARDMFITGGLPADRIVVKPNFVDPDPGVASESGAYALYAGRLELEKGALTLVEAWRDRSLPPLRIAGDGPLRDRLIDAIATHGVADRVELLGHRAPEEILRLMRGARVVVFPSLVYETFGRVLAEAFACGVPVVASRLGAMAEVVEDGITGRLFEPGDPRALAAAVHEVVGPGHAAMRVAARSAYEEHYTARSNLDQLLAIYDRALDLAASDVASSKVRG
jgi:glycosyltransferase involved in cell wall biosynthesis